MDWKSPYKDESLVLISNFFYWKLTFTVRNVCALIWSRGYDWSKLKVKIIVFHIIRLWHIRSFIYPFAAFVLIQVKPGSDTPIFNYIFPSLYKSGIISTIYRKYSKLFIEIIRLPGCYGMSITSNNFFI